MSPDDPSQSEALAINHLKWFGLSSYAARTFVTLVRLEEGTAQDISNVSSVPRTRVYDAAEELHDAGLVDIQNSKPKRFKPISSETTVRRFRTEFDRRIKELSDSLSELEPISQSTQQRGVWTVTGREAISERVVSFIEEATDEIVFMTVEELLSEECITALQKASDRGVTLRLGGMSAAVEETFKQEIPEATLFKSLWDWSDMHAGRILMVDQTKTLASVLVTGNGDHPPEPHDETAIWGTSETNGLVVVLRAMFTWQLEDN